MAHEQLAVARGKVHRTDRHATYYLECGPSSGTPIVFVHGWPELSSSWRHQLGCFGALGFRALAPDMRGYGRSSIHPNSADYSVEEIVRDMIELVDGLGIGKAIWVGHDWGSPIVWNIAAQHPDRVKALVSLCVPYIPQGWARPNLVPLVDRNTYPASTYPSGQWEYWDHYEHAFEKATSEFERDVTATVSALFRRGNPDGIDLPEVTGQIRNAGGWIPFIEAARTLPFDDQVVNQQEMDHYVAELTRNGFFGPDSWYMNDERNIAYAKTARDGGRLELPVLFVAGKYDFTCKVAGTRLAEPMRAACADLTEAVIESGHWMNQEKPAEVNAVLARWFAERLPDAWIAGASQ